MLFQDLPASECCDDLFIRLSSRCVAAWFRATIPLFLALSAAASFSLAFSTFRGIFLAFSTTGSVTFSRASAVVTFPIAVFIDEIFALGTGSFGIVLIA
jgi:hypothetical protein